MRPRKTRNIYQIFIGAPISMGRVAVTPTMKEARRVESFYKMRKIPVRIVPIQRKEVIAP